MLENYDYQMSQNSDFNKYRESMDFQMQKVNDFLTKDEFQVGQEYTDKEVEEFRGVFDDYIAFTEDFVSNHADRLQSSGNQYILNELAHGTNANRFMLDSFFNDKKIDKVEYDAYRQAIASNSQEPITNYKEYNKRLMDHASNTLIKTIDANIQKANIYENVIYKGGSLSLILGDDYEGETFETLVRDSPLKEQIEKQHVDILDEIESDDSLHRDKHARSYIDQVYPNFRESIDDGGGDTGGGTTGVTTGGGDKNNNNEETLIKKIVTDDGKKNEMTTRREISAIEKELKKASNNLKSMKASKNKGYNVSNKKIKELENKVKTLQNELSGASSNLEKFSSKGKMYSFAKQYLINKGIDTTKENIEKAVEELGLIEADFIKKGALGVAREPQYKDSSAFYGKRQG
jgi:DNA-binding GntR family transcriptional regulator